MDTTCEVCGAHFTRSKYSKTRTCSDPCAKTLRAEKAREATAGKYPRVEVECANPECSTKFFRGVNKTQKYCSRACFHRGISLDAQECSTCSVCGKEFTHYSRQEQNTCSVQCAAKTRERNYPECKVCGASTGSYNRIYCSDHRPARPGRKPLPRKTAVCQSCGETFSRPGTWPGKMMFCSIKCSNEQHSRYRTQHFEFGEVHLSSGYELRFLACLLRFDVVWQPWPDDDPFVYSDNGVRREYRPDFKLSEIAVEVKGWEDESSPQKIARGMWDRPEQLITVNEGKLRQLERCTGHSSFMKALLG